MSKLKEKYRKEVVPALIKELDLKNPMEVPRLEKIALNMGVGAASGNQRLIEEAVGTLTAITGQKAVVTRAKKAISNFKLKEKMPIGAKVTLHGDRMWDFLERLISIALPRVRDFRGISSKAFDGRGNYTLGLKDQLIFPEIDYSKVEKTKGMNICITTTAKTDAEGLALLKSEAFKKIDYVVVHPANGDLILKEILQPLEPFRAKTLTLHGVCDKVRGDGDNHMRGMGCLLTGSELFPGNIQGGSDTPAGWASGISIDQEIRNFLQSRPETRTRFGSLEFGIGVADRADPWTRMSYAGANQPVAPIEPDVLDRIRNVPLGLLDRRLVDQRALGDALLGAVADLHRLDLGGELVDEGVVNAVLHVDAVGADAGLAHVAIFRHHGAVDRGVDVGIVEHDERRVAAQFHAGLLDGGRAHGQKLGADLGRAGEGQLAHVGTQLVERQPGDHRHAHARCSNQTHRIGHDDHQDDDCKVKHGVR